MNGIGFSNKGDFKKTREYLRGFQSSGGRNAIISDKVLSEAGQMGVDALSDATPIRTGRLASSWSYRIVHDNDAITIEWHNDDIEGGENIALLVQYGHGTGRGTYVTPRDYINPAMAPVFDAITEMVMKEVSK